MVVGRQKHRLRDLLLFHRSEDCKLRQLPYVYMYGSGGSFNDCPHYRSASERAMSCQWRDLFDDE